MGIKAIAKLAPVHVVYTISAGEAADIGIFVADQDYEITVTAYEGSVHIVLKPVRTNTTY